MNNRINGKAQPATTIKFALTGLVARSARTRSDTQVSIDQRGRNDVVARNRVQQAAQDAKQQNPARPVRALRASQQPPAASKSQLVKELDDAQRTRSDLISNHSEVEEEIKQKTLYMNRDWQSKNVDGFHEVFSPQIESLKEDLDELDESIVEINDAIRTITNRISELDRIDSDVNAVVIVVTQPGVTRLEQQGEYHRPRPEGT